MSNKTVEQEKDFTVAMQQLSAEAEKIRPAMPIVTDNSFLKSPDQTKSAPPSKILSEQLQTRVYNLLGRIEKLSADMDATRRAAFAQHFKKIDEQLALIRNTESVNQQLFDSLHAELLKYRDNFLHESLQKPFIHDLVNLYDDLTALGQQLRNASEERGGKRGYIAQWRDNLENAIHSLVEILHRFEVNEIEAKERVDRSYHKILSYEPADFPEEDGCIVMRVKRGFVWRGKLLRPEEVIAKRFG